MSTTSDDSPKYICVVTTYTYEQNGRGMLYTNKDIELVEGETVNDVFEIIDMRIDDINTSNTLAVKTKFNNGADPALRTYIDRSIDRFDGVTEVRISPIYEIARIHDIFANQEKSNVMDLMKVSCEEFMREVEASSKRREEKEKIKRTKDKEQRRQVYEQLKKEFESDIKD